MERKWNEDIDTENFQVAQTIFENSRNVQDDLKPDTKVLETIRAGRTGRRTERKTKFTKMRYLTAVAACAFVCIVGINTIRVNHSASDNHEMNNEINGEISKDETNANSHFGGISQADDYDKIYKLLSQIQKAQKQYYMGTGSVMGESDFRETEDNAGPVNKTNAINGGNDYYDTNSQTQGVGEGDVVKTDGRHIYALRCAYDDETRKESVVISSVDGKKVTQVSKIHLPDSECYWNELYICGNKLIVIGEVINYDAYCGISDCAVTEYDRNLKNTVNILVYDITDMENPVKVSDNKQDGRYVSSRFSDGYLYTISEYDVYEVTRESFVPSVNGEKMDCESILLPENPNKTSYVVLTALNVEKSDDFCASVAYLGGCDNIYVSNSGIYVVNSVSERVNITDTKKGKEILFKNKENALFEADIKESELMESEKDMIKKEYDDIDFSKIEVENTLLAQKVSHNTNIVKFLYGGGKIEKMAEKSIEGIESDNLMYDEKDGYLRLVNHESVGYEIESWITVYDENGKKISLHDENGNDMQKFLRSDIYAGSEKETNNVYVLDNRLNQVAKISGLAKNEEIYSARFYGDYGYFVTYENTDPLFTVDFSDIENPVIAGEIKMPGYSQYLHFYTDDLLLGLGTETNPDTQKEEGIKLEMYNISDGKARRQAKLITEYDYSASVYNYKSMLVDSQKQLIGFCATDYDEDELGDEYVLYSYDGDKFVRKAAVKVRDTDLVRGLYVGDYLYVVDPNWGITTISLKNHKAVAKIAFK